MILDIFAIFEACLDATGIYMHSVIKKHALNLKIAQIRGTLIY
ncbi:hypothetical protein HMPREF1572_01059 [Gardnerella vaginalis JCP7275]|nr:hypothetical protein HMPREF1572_01059 [Gardnerella vaginalis JCP7275]